MKKKETLRDNPEKMREYKREWGKRNTAITRNYRRRVRKRVLEKLGGKCVYCGCDVDEILEINHKHGGGGKEYNEKYNCTVTFHLDILKGRRSIDDLELTCRVCNAMHYVKVIKGIEGHVVEWKKPDVA